MYRFAVSFTENEIIHVSLKQFRWCSPILPNLPFFIGNIQENSERNEKSAQSWWESTQLGCSNPSGNLTSKNHRAIFTRIVHARVKLRATQIRTFLSFLVFGSLPENVAGTWQFFKRFLSYTFINHSSDLVRLTFHFHSNGNWWTSRNPKSSRKRCELRRKATFRET